MTTTNDAMRNHTYPGEYRSAIARAKRVLLAAGLPWSVTTGRYHPFANEQKTTNGVRVTRIGCSSTISLHVWGNHYSNPESRAADRALMQKALEVLRADGLPFDDRGWLECSR